VLVQNVTNGGAADSAGIQGGTKIVAIEGQDHIVGGDIIVSINGIKVVGMDALAGCSEENTIARRSVKLGVVRAGTYTTLNVVLGTPQQ
jgi:S1-C subfamily serine protease